MRHEQLQLFPTKKTQGLPHRDNLHLVGGRESPQPPPQGGRRRGNLVLLDPVERGWRYDPDGV